MQNTQPWVKPHTGWVFSRFLQQILQSGGWKLQAAELVWADSYLVLCLTALYVPYPLLWASALMGLPLKAVATPIQKRVGLLPELPGWGRDALCVCCSQAQVVRPFGPGWWRGDSVCPRPAAAGLPRVPAPLRSRCGPPPARHPGSSVGRRIKGAGDGGRGAFIVPESPQQGRRGGLWGRAGAPPWRPRAPAAARGRRAAPQRPPGPRLGATGVRLYPARAGRREAARPGSARGAGGGGQWSAMEVRPRAERPPHARPAAGAAPPPRPGAAGGGGGGPRRLLPPRPSYNRFVPAPAAAAPRPAAPGMRGCPGSPGAAPAPRPAAPAPRAARCCRRGAQVTGTAPPPSRGDPGFGRAVGDRGASGWGERGGRAGGGRGEQPGGSLLGLCPTRLSGGRPRGGLSRPWVSGRGAAGPGRWPWVGSAGASATPGIRGAGSAVSPGCCVQWGARRCPPLGACCECSLVLAAGTSWCPSWVPVGIRWAPSGVVASAPAVGTWQWAPIWEAVAAPGARGCGMTLSRRVRGIGPARATFSHLSACVTARMSASHPNGSGGGRRQCVTQPSGGGCGLSPGGVGRGEASRGLYRAHPSPRRTCPRGAEQLRERTPRGALAGCDV